MTQSSMGALQTRIEAAWEIRDQFSPAQAPADVRQAVDEALAALDAGSVRVAEPDAAVPRGDRKSTRLNSSH